MSKSEYMNLKTRVQKQQKKKIRKIRFYHSFLTIILILCLLQIGWSALLNIAKIVFYQAKIITAKELKAEAEERNYNLKNEIDNFSSMYKVESIARNNLKMAAKDEVLIIINDNKKEEEEKEETKPISDNKIVKFLENIAEKFGTETANDK